MKLSIIIPVYNAEKYLETCVMSFADSVKLNYEVLLIDDGSTDNSLEVCNSLSERNSNIRVIKKENGGVSSARNRGITESKGEYLMFIDSDDYLEVGAINKIIDILNKKNNQLIIFGYNRVKNNAINTELASYSGDVCIDEVLKIMLDNKSLHYFNYPWNKIYNTKIIKENNLLFNEKINLGEDAIFNMKYMKYISAVMFVRKCIYNYRVSEGNTLSTKIMSVDYLLTTYNTIFDSYVSLYKYYNCYEKYKKEINSRYLDYLIGLLNDLMREKNLKSSSDRIKFLKETCINSRLIILNSQGKSFSKKLTIACVYFNQYTILYLIYKMKFIIKRMLTYFL